MARYTSDEYAQMVLMPVLLERQLMPGTLAFAIHELVQRRVDTTIFDSKYMNDTSGCSADDPTLWLQVILWADSRGIIASRKIAQACREHIVLMALACGAVPDHSTIATFVSSMTDEIRSIFRDILLVGAEQDLWGGTHFARDGIKLSSTAAKASSGICADWRRKQEKLAEKVQSWLAQPATADQEGEAAIANVHRAEQEQVQEQIERWEKPAARIEAFLEKHEPKRGQRGKALQSHVTANDSAKMQTAHGVIQGYNGQAVVDAKPHVIRHAEACGSGQDDGHVAPMLEGANANGQAMGLPEHELVGNIWRADSHDHREENLKTGAPAQVDA